MRLYSEARFKEGLDRAIALHRAEPRLAATNYCVGHGLGATNRQHEALPFLRKAVQIEPRNADFLIRYSRALLDTGHIREAESNLMRARDINPKLSIIPWTLAVFYSSINRFDKAVRHFEEVMKIGLPEPVANGVRLDWAQALVEVGRTEEAETILRPLLNDDKARAAALGRLSAFAAFPEGSTEYALLDDEIRRHANDGEKRFVLLSAKARCRAAMKDYEGEYALIAESNAARAGRDMVPSFRYVVDGMIAGFTPQTIAELGELADGHDTHREDPVFPQQGGRCGRIEHPRAPAVRADEQPVLQRFSRRREAGGQQGSARAPARHRSHHGLSLPGQGPRGGQAAA